jgi:uncharacterized membrane protein YccC
MAGTGGVIGRIVRETSQIDRMGVEPWFGIRCTIGVAIPLIVSYAAGHPLSGVSAAIGALVVGFASRQGVYRTRAAAMLFTSAATGISAFVGSISGGHPALSVLIAVLWGLAFGVLASLGPSANAVGLNAVIALIVFSQFGFTPEQAAQQALLVFSGGALQTLLLVSIWPLQRFSAERAVLAKAYRALAQYAENSPLTKLQSPDAQPLSDVGNTLADPQPFAKRGETAVFEALLAEAERIRATLGALVTDRYLLDAQTTGDAAEHAVADIGACAHDVLAAIAGALEDARAPDELAATWKTLDVRIRELEEQAGTSIAAAQAVEDARALAGQLRSAWRAATTPADAGAANAAPPSQSHTAQLFGPTVIADAFDTLRASCSLKSAIGQHALRLAVTLGIAQTLAHILPIERGYWIALTAAIVLRPDFTTTFTRGFARVAGTVAGAAVASLIALVLHPGAETYLILAIVSAGIGYTIFSVNYAVYTITITAYVVFLLAFGGLPEHTAVLDRVISTLIGGALALAAYVVWPTWARTLVPFELANVLDAAGTYSRLVLAAYANPAGRDDRAVRAAQLAVRRARTNAEGSVDRLLAEPVRPRALTVRAALGILAASRRYGLATLTVQSRLPRAPVVSHHTLETLSAGLDEGLHTLSQALRDRTDPKPLPRLRDMQIALKNELDRDVASDVAVLVSETDLMVDSVNMMADVLRKVEREPTSEGTIV